VAGDRRLTAIATVAVVLLAVGGLGSSPAAAAVSDSIAWGPGKPSGPSLQCARIQVPLDWGEPDGRTISLALIRHLASNPDQRIGTLFINPGGPADTGVGLVQGLGAMLDRWGGGRFDVVSWDPRGTNASTPVRCFTSQRSENRFWAGETIPTTPAASERYSRKTIDLARRCGKVSGWLLPHISTADTARDLDYLRSLVGDPELTYVGLSYGSLLGQTYAGLFPDRIRAMVLDSIVDPVPYSKGAEARVASQVSGADPVFARLLSLCEKAGRKRCALAGGSQTATKRAARLFAQAKRAPIPAPKADPPGPLSYGDLLISQVQHAANSERLAGRREAPRRRRPWRRLGDRHRGAPAADPERVHGRDDVGGDLVRRRPGPHRATQLAAGDRSLEPARPPLRHVAGLVVVGPVRRLGRARPGQLPRTLECDDAEPDPGDRHAL
jgi:pimeloyl-ACP methyl ester carboxylesterase